MAGKRDSDDRPTGAMLAFSQRPIEVAETQDDDPHVKDVSEESPFPRPRQTGSCEEATDPRRRIRSGTRQNESELLRRASRGDEVAAAALFNQHVDVVYRMVCRTLGEHHPDVDDVVQDVFIGALDRADRFEGRSRLSTWLVGIAIRKSIDAVRASERRARWRRLRHWVGISNPTDPLARLEAKSELQTQLSKLNLDQRAIFVLVEIEQYTLKEASEVLNTGLSTLHARLQVARDKLKSAPVAANSSAEVEAT